jgi:7-carboxy-7-deazaguanine synthase
MDIAQVDMRVARVVDIKTPASGEVERNRWENLPFLTPRDQLKFVVCDRADYEWSRTQVMERELNARTMVLFSPSATQLPAVELAEWILADRLPVRLQVQLHKVLWGNVAGK